MTLNVVARLSFGMMLCLGAAAFPLSAAPRASASLPLHCSVVFDAKARISPSAACEAVRRALAASIRRPVHIAGADKQQVGDHVHVSLQLLRRNAVSIVAKGRLRGRPVAYGPVAIDVMDRRLGQADLDRLTVMMAEGLAAN